MSRVLIDTNAYTALMTGDNHVAEELARSEAVLLSPVVLGELYDGFKGGTRKRENHAILNKFLDKPRTVSIAITENTAEWFAEIKQILRNKGLPIPINDVWIAASCMEHGARLVSYDTHFTRIEGLLCWNRI